MKRRLSPQIIAAVLVYELLLAVAGNATAQKIWTSPSSGYWADTNNWSGHSAPIDISTVLITNVNTKIVTIDAATPVANLTIASLKISAPAGSTNTLMSTATAGFVILNAAPALMVVPFRKTKGLLVRALLSSSVFVC